MTVAQLPAYYTGIYVSDGWQNSYLISKDLLTCHDLMDCEHPLMRCPLQAEYFLRQLEPVASREQNWLEIYHYSQGVKSACEIPAMDRLLKTLAEIVASGDLRVFKIKDGNADAG